MEENGTHSSDQIWTLRVLEMHRRVPFILNLKFLWNGLAIQGLVKCKTGVLVIYNWLRIKPFEPGYGQYRRRKFYIKEPRNWFSSVAGLLF